MTTPEIFIKATHDIASERLPFGATILACGWTALGVQVAVILGRENPQLLPQYLTLTANGNLEHDTISVNTLDPRQETTSYGIRGSKYAYQVKRYGQAVTNYPDADVLQSRTYTPPAVDSAAEALLGDFRDFLTGRAAPVREPGQQ